MPFNQFVPKPLTARDIYMYAPATSGVYGISNRREWIYIGESDNIQATLLHHLEDPGTPLMKRKPTGFVFELCDSERRPDRQGHLIGEYAPSCNE